MHTTALIFWLVAERERNLPEKGQSEMLFNFSSHITYYLFAPFFSHLQTSLFPHGKHKLGTWWCCRAGSWQPVPPAHASNVGATWGWKDAAWTKRALLSTGQHCLQVLQKCLVLSSPSKEGLVACEPEEGGNYLKGPTGVVKILWRVKQCCLSAVAFPSSHNSLWQCKSKLIWNTIIVDL